MFHSTAGVGQTIIQATLLLSVSALLVRGLIGLSRCVSAKTQRTVWFLVLVQGIILIPLRLNIPWYASSPETTATTARDLAADPSGEQFRPANRSFSVDPSSPTAAENRGATETPLVSAFRDGLPHVWRGAVLLWGLGMIWCVVGGLWRYLRFLRRLRTFETCDTDWAVQWSELLAVRGVRRSIPFRVSRDVGPALVRRPSGYLVVVREAAWAGLTARQRHLILCHELAHYEHGDLWRSLAARWLALPHWFNPLSWWAVRRLEECTEWLCDRDAANDSASATSAIEYARALLQLGASPLEHTSWVGAAQSNRLVHRIHRLISHPFSEDSKMKKVVLVSAALGMLLVGGVRIHLVANEPTNKMSDGATEKRKPSIADQSPENLAFSKAALATRQRMLPYGDFMGMPSRIGFLQNAGIQEELGMTEAQIEKLGDLRRKYPDEKSKAPQHLNITSAPPKINGKQPKMTPEQQQKALAERQTKLEQWKHQMEAQANSPAGRKASLQAAAMSDLRNQGATSILDKKQLKRLEQLELQWQAAYYGFTNFESGGIGAALANVAASRQQQGQLFSPSPADIQAIRTSGETQAYAHLRKLFDLSDDQLAEIKAIKAKQQHEPMPHMLGPGASREESQAHMAEFKKWQARTKDANMKTEAECIAVLAPEQKARWAEKIGKPFRFEKMWPAETSERWTELVEKPSKEWKTKASAADVR